MATESQLTISPPNCSAITSESAVLPLAVGPRITTSSGSALAEAPVEDSGITNQHNGEDQQRDQQQPERLGPISSLPLRVIGLARSCLHIAILAGTTLVPTSIR